ncbi:MAG: dockerin type I domain-containing protein, partial [Ignavibacteria bacterium]
PAGDPGADPITFAGGESSIAFSVSTIYAYGDNEIKVDSSPYDVYAFYSGDVNHDGLINLTDILSVYNGSTNFQTGYVAADVTGDNVVNLNDITLTYNNSAKFITLIRP